MSLERFLLTSVPKLNEVFRGGLGEESLIHIYGPYQSGKTLLIFQLIYELVMKGYGNALYIDTEASFKNNFSSEMRKRFEDRFGKGVNIFDVVIERYASKGKKRREKEAEIRRYFEAILDDLGLEYSKEDLYDALMAFLKIIELKSTKSRHPSIYVLDTLDLSGLLSILNIEAEVTRVGEKTEVKIKRVGDPLSGSLSKFIRSYNIKFLVIDSLGMMVKGLAIGLADLPARAAVTNLIIGGLIRLASNYRLIIFATNHESRNPVKNYYSFYGGNPIGYGFKYSLYLAKRGVGRRSLVVERAPTIPEKSLSIELEIKDDGFYQVMDGDDKKGGG